MSVTLTFKVKGDHLVRLDNEKIGLIQKGGTTAGTSNLIRNIKVRSIATS